MFVNKTLSTLAKGCKKILYLGLDPSRYVCDAEVIHYPMIRIEPIPLLQKEKAAYKKATDVIVTSRQSVLMLVKAEMLDLSKRYLSVGQATTAFLKESGCTHILTAKLEQAEGVVTLLKRLDLQERFLFYPHSALSRDLIATFLRRSGIVHRECVAYKTFSQALKPLPDLKEFDEVVFTSPSTVDAFCATFIAVPRGLCLTPIGQITKKKLLSKKRLLSYCRVQQPLQRIKK